jgi:hypothetical protein
MDENMQRLAALAIAVALSYAWLLFPSRWRSFDTITIAIRCGTFLAMMMALGQMTVGVASPSDLAAIVAIFYIGPTVMKYAAYSDGAIPPKTWAAAMAAINRRREYPPA